MFYTKITQQKNPFRNRNMTHILPRTTLTLCLKCDNYVNILQQELLEKCLIIAAKVS